MLGTKVGDVVHSLHSPRTLQIFPPPVRRRISVALIPLTTSRAAVLTPPVKYSRLVLKEGLALTGSVIRHSAPVGRLTDSLTDSAESVSLRLCSFPLVLYKLSRAPSQAAALARRRPWANATFAAARAAEENARGEAKGERAGMLALNGPRW